MMSLPRLIVMRWHQCGNNIARVTVEVAQGCVVADEDIIKFEVTMMRKNKRSIGDVLMNTVVVTVLAAASPLAVASIVETGSTNQHILDTDTGLTWYGLDLTRNMSPLDVDANLGTGDYVGFRWATTAEYNELITHFGGDSAVFTAVLGASTSYAAVELSVEAGLATWENETSVSTNKHAFFAPGSYSASSAERMYTSTTQNRQYSQRFSSTNGDPNDFIGAALVSQQFSF